MSKFFRLFEGVKKRKQEDDIWNGFTKKLSAQTSKCIETNIKPNKIEKKKTLNNFTLTFSIDKL